MNALLATRLRLPALPLFGRAARWLVGAAAAAALAACGGGGGDSAPATVARVSSAGGEAIVPGSNVLTIRVDAGTDGSAINSPFVTVTVCQPGTAVCQDVDHVLVDTGSTGLRIAASAVTPALRQSLPAVLTPGGALAGECAHFASGYSWGSVRTADVRLGSETASGLVIQLVDDPAAPYATVPPVCSGTGASIGSGRGAKGILGVGMLNQDCGTACVVSTAPRVYFACPPGGGCTSSTMALGSQVSHPVASLPVNNNGVVMVMPAVPAGGSSSLTGSLVLGIGTQGNNVLGGATVITPNAQGYFTTVYNGVSYPQSFLDSGSNGLFFNDASLPACGDFYCPPGAVSRSATITGANGASTSVGFLVDNVAALPGNTTAAHLGGTTNQGQEFDWGLPFFFGRSVFVARNGAATPYGTGPYWAY